MNSRRFDKDCCYVVRAAKRYLLFVDDSKVLSGANGVKGEFAYVHIMCRNTPSIAKS